MALTLRPNPGRQKRGTKARSRSQFAVFQGRKTGRGAGGMERGVQDEIREEGRCHGKKIGL